MLDELCSEGACAHITSNPLGDIATLVARLRKHPLSGSVYDGSGHRHTATLGEVDLLGILQAGDLNPALRALLPAAVQSALRHDPDPLLRLKLLSEGLIPNVPLPPKPTQTEREAGEEENNALFLATSCEEKPFPWQRSAAPATRRAEALARAALAAERRLLPLRRRHRLGNSLIPDCVDWPDASPTPPPAGAAERPDADLLRRPGPAHPDRQRAAIAAEIPDAQLLVVPYTGHSVIGSDLSGCARDRRHRVLRRHCRPAVQTDPRPLQPDPDLPHQAHLRPAGPRAARQRRPHAHRGARHARRPRAPGDRGDPASRSGTTRAARASAGLHGGYARLSSSAVLLNRLTFVPGVQLSGTLPASDGKIHSITVRIGGSTAAHGTVMIATGQRATGTLGGTRFDVSIAKATLSRVAGAGDAVAGRGWGGAGPAPAAGPRPAGLHPSGARHPQRPATPAAPRRRSERPRRTQTAASIPTLSEWPTRWQQRPPPTCASTPTIPSTGCPGGRPRWRAPRERDVPLLVSIGYSACHWCHVMERESFEDPRMAALMNEEFVCVKVDREERPDVDALYMEAVQGMTGHGGWPLNVFLTPEQLPFYGGTYFPPEPRHGMPAWTQVLQAIAAAWREQVRPRSAPGASSIRARLAGGALLTPSTRPLDPGALDAAVRELEQSFDSLHGGFGPAPEVPAGLGHRVPARPRPAGRGPTAGPHAAPGPRAARRARTPHDVDVCPTSTPPPRPPHARWRCARCARWPPGASTTRSGAAFTATPSTPPGRCRTSRRCSTTTPCSRGPTCTAIGSPARASAGVCRDTLDWALRELRAPEGGFYSALDADSEGGEGSFYVWSLPELREALGEDAPAAISWFGATAQGNFRGESGHEVGLNVLEAHGPEPPPDQRERIRARLLEVRDRRPRPALDDKRLTSWNALMIAALADAGSELARSPRQRRVAQRRSPRQGRQAGQKG